MLDGPVHDLSQNNADVLRDIGNKSVPDDQRPDSSHDDETVVDEAQGNGTKAQRRCV